MNSKKIRHTQPDPGQKPVESAEIKSVPTPNNEQLVEEPPTHEDLQKQLEELKSQAEEYKDGWQRSVADFQNFRRRVEADKAEMYQTALGSIIKRYLPVLDDLERALAACPADLAWVEGIELICRKLQNILEAEGLRRIEAESQTFDPHFHEAISQEPSEDHTSGQIIAVVQNGYTLGDRVIRPALVRVAK
jgi:molecular chaperone GrpE